MYVTQPHLRPCPSCGTCPTCGKVAAPPTINPWRPASPTYPRPNYSQVWR